MSVKFLDLQCTVRNPVCIDVKMKKRNSSKVSIVSNTSGVRVMEMVNIPTKTGVFTFPNGDKYTGDYQICGHPPYIVRQGPGIYDTDDFNKYETVWDRDRITKNVHIRFNNGTEYKGSVDENGRMSGPGTYFLPDGASIEAEWNQNRLLRDIRYREPLGFIWNGAIAEDDKVIFKTGNHFWDDMILSENRRSRERAIEPKTTENVRSIENIKVNEST